MSPLPIGPIQSPVSIISGVDAGQTARNLATDLNALNIPRDTKFSEMLGNFVSSVVELGNVSEGAKDAFLSGQEIDLHEVMIAGEIVHEADLKK